MSKILLSTPRFDVIETPPRAAGYDRDFFIEKQDGVSIAVRFGGSVLMLEINRPGQSSPWLEFPGGGVDTGEAPAEAAERELFEETGLEISNVAEVGRIAPLPGYVSERVTLFTAVAESKDTSRIDAGVGHEGIVGSHLISIKELSSFCRRGRISSAVDAYFAMLLTTLDGETARYVASYLFSLCCFGARFSRRGPVNMKLGRMMPPRPISLILLFRTTWTARRFSPT
nr:NUDIX domain-containing protein [Flavimaribacter sediminis]